MGLTGKTGQFLRYKINLLKKHGDTLGTMIAPTIKVLLATAFLALAVTASGVSMPVLHRQINSELSYPCQICGLETSNDCGRCSVCPQPIQVIHGRDRCSSSRGHRPQGRSPRRR